MTDDTTEKTKAAVQALSARQKQIAQLIIKGYRVRDIATFVHLSSSTVVDEIARIKRALGAKNQYHFGYLLQIGGLE